MNKKDLDFLFEVGSLRNIQRGWRQHLGMDCANVLEHTMRVIWLSIIIARMEGVKTEEKIIKLAMVHDIAETRTSDLGYVQKIYVKADEEKAAQDLLCATSLKDFNDQILKEYETRETVEAKIVKDADNLDVELELKELAERGSKLPEKFSKFRQMIHDEKLYTDSAKKIWEDIQTAEISNWHLTMNKWLNMPDAGK